MERSHGLRSPAEAGTPLERSYGLRSPAKAGTPLLAG